MHSIRTPTRAVKNVIESDSPRKIADAVNQIARLTANLFNDLGELTRQARILAAANRGLQCKINNLHKESTDNEILSVLDDDIDIL